MNDFEKAQKNLKNDMIVLLILEIIIIIFLINLDQFPFFLIVSTPLSFFGYKYAKKGERKAGTIGIIVGVLMMLTILQLDIIDFLLGLFVLRHSLKYNKLIQKDK